MDKDKKIDTFIMIVWIVIGLTFDLPVSIGYACGFLVAIYLRK